ncbi:protein-ADP-ribose hydrolase [Saliterribacillus persicus]|uniref:O-acetyl-ADP-ribose deacetylase (Regulator of RNase III) n=1 Tax=Saliterribacillus persicus TaxID=930114 RepID=A0A368X7H7_9BACI|nr:protein-ADP-ribose hydrolase [Saliterribacillus persicus]RCW63146.1 O-acetyl-ADP-ribose deacetylase (regulator of RNase III) [Saliterribacillus persicus]
MPQFKLKDYAPSIQLYSKYTTFSDYMANKEEVLNDLLDFLLKEKNDRKIKIPLNYPDKRRLLRGLLNVRQPRFLPHTILEKIDVLLQIELKEKSVIEVEQLNTVRDLVSNNLFNQSDKFILWQGDISLLQTDAIVNAANKYLLGCFQPLHSCIDNAIHSVAGPLLREDCKTIISIQDRVEKTGDAKITRGYNLPANFVLHTVGPIVEKGTKLTNKQKEDLASCYSSCLELANQIPDIKSLAFCAISTGVFGFPKQEAARVAVETVNDWLNLNPHHFEKIVFNVYSEEDYNVYFRLFQQ